ncbi:HERC1 [Symbiodinium pilosum]|uniref:HERC1 protein n=1 Tax=Symbiodinium pilosum TaxID=2952 RepID=A0A812J1Y8_SYMPI|nr:HERC1 [Symbiodinium pilosum]
MSLNHVMLEIVALTWCPLHSAPKMLPIELCRREVKVLRQEMGLPTNLKLLEVDASGMKRLFSHGIRRVKSRAQTSEPILEKFFDLLDVYWANADEEAIQQMLAIEDGSPYDGYESAEGAGLPDGEGEIPETQVIPTHSDEEEEDVEDALPETPPASPTHVSAELEKSREDSHATASVLPKCGTHEPSQDSGATATVSPKHGTHEPSEDSDAAASVLPNRGTHVVAEPCDGASVVPACDLPFRGHPIRALLPLPGQWEELTPHPADPPAKTHAFDEAAASNKLTPEGRAKLLAHLASRKEKIRQMLATRTHAQQAAPPTQGPNPDNVETQGYDADAAHAETVAVLNRGYSADSARAVDLDLDVAASRADVELGKASALKTLATPPPPQPEKLQPEAKPSLPLPSQVEKPGPQPDLGKAKSEVEKPHAQQAPPCEEQAAKPMRPQVESPKPSEPVNKELSNHEKNLSDMDVDSFPEKVHVKRTDQRAKFSKEKEKDLEMMENINNGGRGRGRGGRGRGRSPAVPEGSDEEPAAQSLDTEDEGSQSADTKHYSESEAEPPAKRGGVPKARGKENIVQGNGKPAKKKAAKVDDKEEPPRKKSRASKDEPESEKKGSKGRKTFASRRPPTTADALCRFEILRDTFKEQISINFATPSVWELDWWNFAFPKLTERGVSSEAYPELAKKYATKFLRKHRDHLAASNAGDDEE